MPFSKVFETEIPVQINHINYGNHLGYDCMVALLHEAQVRMLNFFNYSELDVQGCYLVVQRIEVVYKKEAFYGDILSFKIGFGETTKVRQDLIFSVENNQQQEVCHAVTTVTFVDHQTRKIVAVPAFFRELK